MSYLAAQRAHQRTLTARYDDALAATKAARAAYREAKASRIATVNGESEGCPGIAWTNEERADADLDAAIEREQALYQQIWDLDQDIADAKACRRAESVFDTSNLNAFEYAESVGRSA